MDDSHPIPESFFDVTYFLLRYLTTSLGGDFPLADRLKWLLCGRVLPPLSRFICPGRVLKDLELIIRIFIQVFHFLRNILDPVSATNFVNPVIKEDFKQSVCLFGCPQHLKQ